MCHSRKVRFFSRCKTCRESRCIECGSVLVIFVRTLHAVKFRKRQWKHELYEHHTLIKTRTFERLCVNPECPRHWNPDRLPPDWIPVPVKKVAVKKTFDEAVAEIEQAVQ
jgi:hypothetical protein